MIVIKKLQRVVPITLKRLTNKIRTILIMLQPPSKAHVIYELCKLAPEDRFPLASIIVYGITSDDK